MVEQENPRRVWKSRRKRIEGKTQYVRVSMSESERAALMVLEQQTGLSPSALMVEAVFGSADPVAVQLRRNQLAELIQMRHQMATIANNVNQIARHANSTGEVLPETAETLREARRFGDEVLAKIEELIP
ncbi:mobilization protein [Kocuria sp. CNJ-770]|uniref:Plasmid mobilization relaxosome protein MobC n=1 Tax=Kocuria oceani TaxID=988827 RepID=A0ABV9TN39_9MICC|nr:MULTISPECIES: plasmid mobilization relaxosome protein MobC [Kocuria]OLT13655.1 mobilization protein [Kocuria sp. CNJ-770]WJZ68483.1 plasmid mobilization relaxosome protein MobC [Kocuria rosea]